MENDAELNAFLAAYKDWKSTPDGDSEELEERTRTLRHRFNELIQEEGCDLE